MTRQLEAVFEKGVLRPLEPLPLAEHQKVLVTIDDLPTAAPPNSRQAEMEWLGAHQNEFPGEWVALQGSELISHGSTLRLVLEEARQRGVEPLMVHIPDEPDLPSAGWL